jgi:nucleotide-binding universal stress UspA family protein
MVRRPRATGRTRLNGRAQAWPLTRLEACGTLAATLTDPVHPTCEEHTMYKHILVPTDGSEISTKAAQHAIALARLTGAKLSALSVKEPFPYSAISEMQPTPPQEFYDAQERMAAARVKAVVELAAAAGVECASRTVEAVHPWEAICDHAREQQCDLIVMASHGRRGIAALLLGSETQKVLTHSTTPVLIVR